MKFVTFVYKIVNKLKRIIFNIINYFSKKMFISCGKNVDLGYNNRFYFDHMIVGNNVSFGSNSIFMSSIAKIIIGDHVMFGPRVMVITGNHTIDIPNTYMYEVNTKNVNDDQDVIFEGDNWVGAGAIILKGVTIKKGTVIGAGSVVTKSTEEYSVYAGNPARKIKNRFEEIK